MDVALSASVSLPRRPEWRCVWNHLLGRVEQPDPPVAVVLLGAAEDDDAARPEIGTLARTIAARFGLTLASYVETLDVYLLSWRHPDP